MTIDALGRAVDSGFQTATFYSPDGSLRIAFKGQLTRRAFLWLPGGGWAIFDVCGGGLTEYDHPDHLGSIRLASSPGRSFSYSTRLVWPDVLTLTIQAVLILTNKLSTGSLRTRLWTTGADGISRSKTRETQ